MPRRRRPSARVADLKKRGFRFRRADYLYAHMQATGMVNDHTVDCFRWSELKRRLTGGSQQGRPGDERADLMIESQTILCINSGSSSLKFHRLRGGTWRTPRPGGGAAGQRSGGGDRAGQGPDMVGGRAGGLVSRSPVGRVEYEDAIEQALAALSGAGYPLDRSGRTSGGARGSAYFTPGCWPRTCSPICASTRPGPRCTCRRA